MAVSTLAGDPYGPAMITPAEAAASAARTRPTTVTVAFVLQLVVVAVLLGFAVLTVVEAVVYDGLIDEAARLTQADPEEVATERVSNVEWAVMSGLPAVALLTLFAATAFPLRSGSKAARILTWVGAGFPMVCGVVCGGFGALAAIPLLLSEELEEEGLWLEESAFYDKLYEIEADGLSGWLTVAVPVLFVVAVMISIAVAVLLAVPPSNRFFHRPPPPVATPGYPFAHPVPPGYALVPIAAIVPWTAANPPATKPDDGSPTT